MGDFSFQFTDNSKQVSAAIEKAVRAALEEAGGEIEAQAKRNSRSSTGDTKGSFRHEIDGDSVHIGSSLENAVWEEFGTGTYAENGGKPGYWVFVKGSGGGGRSNGRSYTLQEAKQVMAILRSQGLEAYYTNGKRGTRALTKAFEAKKPIVEKIFKAKLGAIE